ncbi:MAG: SPASM domain-containing protein, partial [Sedimentisphaerales bacterium]|nr:SPASM domain-containing protein [Sedimentisphaerales bacterium]
ATFNPFLLVPTGRGRELADEALPPEQYESLLHQIKDLRHTTSLIIRVTCAPHYQRILREDPTENQIDHSPGGCLGGKSFAFISHTGQVQICGFLETSAGQLTAPAMDFRTIWNTSPFLDQIRRVDDYHGKCGWCEYRTFCGGCRARAYALTGDPFAPEPFCVYHPPRPAGSTR